MKFSSVAPMAVPRQAPTSNLTTSEADPHVAIFKLQCLPKYFNSLGVECPILSYLSEGFCIGSAVFIRAISRWAEAVSKSLPMADLGVADLRHLAMSGSWFGADFAMFLATAAGVTGNDN